MSAFIQARRHYLLDLENIQSNWTCIFPLLQPGDVVTLFLSDKCIKLCTESFSDLTAMGALFRLVECENGHPNAMDFQLVAEMGRLSVMEPPGTEFIIVSNDKGFDSTIGLMAKRGVAVRRFDPLNPNDGTEPKASPIGVKEQYRRMLESRGVEDPVDLTNITQILYESMAEEPGRRKLGALNRLRTKYGDAKGRLWYAALQDLVHQLADQGPWPERATQKAIKEPAKTKKPMPDATTMNSLLATVIKPMATGNVKTMTLLLEEARTRDNPEEYMQLALKKAGFAGKSDGIIHVLKPYF